MCLPPVTFTIVLGDTQMRSYSPCILGALTLRGDTDRNMAEYKLSDYTWQTTGTHLQEGEIDSAKGSSGHYYKGIIPIVFHRFFQKSSS